MDSKAKGIGEALAILGVIASLGFVAAEIRQNTAAVRGATLQAVSQQSLDLAMAGLDNADLRAAFRAGSATDPETVSAEHQGLLRWFFQAKLRADENRFRQVELGTLNASTFGQLSNNQAYRLPFFAWWWAQNGDLFAPDFQTVVEREFLPLSGSVRDTS